MGHPGDFDKADMEKAPESRFKKFFIFVVGVLLVILMVTYIFASYPLSSIIKGQLESTPLQENVLMLDDFSIYLENGTSEALQDIYFAEQKVEFSVCLQGEKKGADYYIISLYEPVMHEQSFAHVSFEPCSEDSLMLLHSHPYKSCIASQTDMDTLEKTKQRNPDVLMVVMCEPARFSVYD